MVHALFLTLKDGELIRLASEPVWVWFTQRPNRRAAQGPPAPERRRLERAAFADVPARLDLTCSPRPEDPR